MKVKKMTALVGAALLTTGAAIAAAPLAGAVADDEVPEGPIEMEIVDQDEEVDSEGSELLDDPDFATDPDADAEDAEEDEDAEEEEAEEAAPRPPRSSTSPRSAAPQPRRGERGVPARTGDNAAALATAGGALLISVAGGVYVLRRRTA